MVSLIWRSGGARLVKDAERHPGGSVAAVRASPPHVGQVEGDDPDKKAYPGPPGWGFGLAADNLIT